MKRLLRPILFAAAVMSVPAMSLPAAAQTPPTQGWPANRPPAAQPTPPAAGAPAAPAQGGQPQQATGATGTPPPVPLPQWFVEIDTAKKGEVSRADFLKYRMKSFEELDVNKDGKLSLDEFLKVAEPPMSQDVPGGPNLEERRNRAKVEFQTLDTNRDDFIERAEAEALVHSEFNQYDTDRDNKVTEPEVRLIVQRSMAREAQARQEMERHGGSRPAARASIGQIAIPKNAATALR
jgi:Ca2+-binding EF-hand superfamily protein